MMTPEVSMSAQNAPLQTYANHRRIDPMYHVVGFGLLLTALVLAIVHLVRLPGYAPVWELVASLVMLILFLKVRAYALHNQDRLIRLEESQRMARLLAEPLRSRIHELKPGQFVALRFASDEELADLVEQVLAEGLEREAIKGRIRTWRADTFRV
jgi:hypothetical protein